MPQITDRPLTRVCIRLWKDDYEKLRLVSQASGETGLNHLIRTIVHSYVTQLNAIERRNLDKLGPITMTVNDDDLDLLVDLAGENN